MRNTAYVLRLIRFALNANPLLYLSILVSVASAGVEILAMSSLLPLFEIVAGGPPSTKMIVVRIITFLGFPVDSRSLLWAFISLFAFRIVSQICGQSLSTLLGKRLIAQLTAGAFSHMMHNLPIRDINTKSIGFYISLAGDESFRASNLMISLTQFVSMFALATLYFLAIAFYSPAAGAYVMGFVCCAMVVMLQILRISHRLGSSQTEQSRKAGTLFVDSLNNIKAVRAFSAEAYVVAMHRSLMFGYAKILFWIDELSLLTRLLPVLLLLVFFSIWLLLSSARIETVGIAFVVTIIVYLLRFFPVLGQLVTIIMRIASDAKSGQDVTQMLGRPPVEGSTAPLELQRLNSIDVREVEFSYGGRDSKAVLRGINVRFERGRSYALIGKSGLGKSTLVELLLKFYEPTAGTILLNGVSITEKRDSDVRSRVILVSQESAIFDDTVTNNVCLGAPRDMVAVREVCELAEIHSTVEAMPKGYESRLHYRGANLSGGQRQRIAIARALLRRPDVLILDEATSALDKMTQSRVIDNVLRRFSDGIVIFVTHDPQVIARVDRVIDMEELNICSVLYADNAGDVVTGVR